MDDYEKIARQQHKEGKNCSYSIYNSFKKDYNLNGEYPLPRSIDGKCGAVLTTIKVLSDLGLDKYISEFEKKFNKEFGNLKCLELMKKDRRCNDYVGFAANQISKYLKAEKTNN